MPEQAAFEKVRIDKWLWAARFFKTRSLAAKAVSGGQVQVNGTRVKPSRFVQPGEELRIRKGSDECTVVVLAVSGQRRGAPEARTLYEETAESLRLREQRREQRRSFIFEAPSPEGKPGKRDRRLIRKFIRKSD